jgi:hypothetical protein
MQIWPVLFCGYAIRQYRRIVIDDDDGDSARQNWNRFDRCDSRKDVFTGGA